MKKIGLRMVGIEPTLGRNIHYYWHYYGSDTWYLTL
jgi:hypothetical protein